MSNTLKHKKVSAATANPDDAIVDSADWNTEHAFAGGASGDVLIRDTGQTDGARFLAGPAINVQAPPYNAVGNGIVDDTVALNTAFAFASNNDRAVFLPAGTYKITDTLWVTPQGSTFQSAHITGAGRGYSSATAQTLIDATALVGKPALNILRARAVYLGHFAIRGPNVAPSALTNATRLYSAIWVTTAPVVRDSRYSPQCGIAIDAGGGPTPPDGGYAGFTYLNTAGGTSDVHLDHIGIRECVVGIMHNPESSVATQGDVVLVTSPQIQDVKVGIAVGQSQARCFTVLGGNVTSCREAYNSTEYGQQQGASVTFQGTQLGMSYQLFSHSPGFSPLLFDGVRAESLFRLGTAGTGAVTAAYPIVFQSCDLHMGSSCDPTPVILESGSSSIEFVGGRLHVESDANVDLPIHINAPMVTFHGTQFQVPNRFRPYIGNHRDLADAVMLHNCRVRDGTSAVNYNLEGRGPAVTGRISAHWSTMFMNTRLAQYLYVPGAANGYITTTTASAWAFTATTVAFTLSDVSVIQVGDLIEWLMDPISPSTSQRRTPGATVTSIVGTTVTCTLLWPRVYYDEAHNPTSIAILVHEWAPGEALTGDVTSGSPTMSNVAPTTILQNGDWLKGVVPATVTSVLATNARVLSGGGTATVTMNKNATATQVGARLFYGRLHTLTTTAAF